MIKDFAEDRIPLMRQRIMEATLNGYRLDKVEKILQQEFGFMANKARFLAFNETNIMLAEFKRSQYQAMGFSKFIWQTRADSRVRDLHQHLNGTVWRYDDPPVIDERTGQKGLPGETFNCRCIALPYSEKSFFDGTYIDGDKKEKKVFTSAQSQKRLAEYLG